MNETVYINSELQENFRELGLGNIDNIKIYRVEGDKCFFRAGRGKLWMTKAEIKSAQVPSPLPFPTSY
jgi:hypothetical protein